MRLDVLWQLRDRLAEAMKPYAWQVRGLDSFDGTEYQITDRVYTEAEAQAVRTEYIAEHTTDGKRDPYMAVRVCEPSHPSAIARIDITWLPQESRITAHWHTDVEGESEAYPLFEFEGVLFGEARFG